MSFTEPIVVTGQLHVATVQSPYGDVSFKVSVWCWPLSLRRGREGPR